MFYFPSLLVSYLRLNQIIQCFFPVFFFFFFVEILWFECQHLNLCYIFKFIFVHGVRCGSMFIYFSLEIQLLSSVGIKDHSFPVYLDTFVENQLSIQCGFVSRIISFQPVEISSVFPLEQFCWWQILSSFTWECLYFDSIPEPYFCWI